MIFDREIISKNYFRRTSIKSLKQRKSTETRDPVRVAMATIKKIKTKEAGNSLVNDATPVYRARSKSISGKALKRNACYTLCNISKVPLPNMNISPYHSVLKNRGKAQFKVGYHFEFNAFEFYCSTCGLYFQTLDLYHEHVMIR